MEKPFVVGIDIGGTGTVFGIVDSIGNIVSKGSIPTVKHADINSYIDELYEAIAEQMVKLGGLEKISGIGVGSPCGNFNSGTIENAVNLPWRGTIRFSELMKDKFSIDTVITNDANVAAIGEMKFGVAKDIKNFIMITLGTGVGSCIVSDGKIIYGENNLAGELGHICIDRNGRSCGCGRKGCLETYTSATGVVRTAREMLFATSKDSLLRNIPIECITSEDIYNAAVNGDEIAKEIFEYTGRILGESFSDFVAFTDPKAIVLFGGLTNAGDLLYQPIVEHMEKNLLFLWKGKVDVLFSELKEDNAPILGAAALAWEFAC